MCVLSGGRGTAGGTLGHPPQRLIVVRLSPPGCASSLKLGVGIGLEALPVPLQTELEGGGKGGQDWNPNPQPPQTEVPAEPG